MKICCRCGKDGQEFNKNARRKDGLQGVCKKCQSEYTKQHYQNNKLPYLERARGRNSRIREMVRAAKTKKCADCNVMYPYWIMEFDHLDGDQKIDSVSRMRMDGSSEEALLAEIQKCEVVCANCHKNRTYLRAVEAQNIRRALGAGGTPNPAVEGSIPSRRE